MVLTPIGPLLVELIHVLILHCCGMHLEILIWRFKAKWCGLNVYVMCSIHTLKLYPVIGVDVLDNAH